MGASQSKSADDTEFTSVDAAAFDGLRLAPRPNGLPAPTPDSKTKLHQLFRANHQFFATLYNNRNFHNHVAHALGSAYFLGATPEMLYDIYEESTEPLAHWEEDSPAEVTDNDWFEFLGDKRYERGFQDYFQDKITDNKTYNWKEVYSEFVYDERAPGALVHALFGGLLHPLIHLGYAAEFNNWELASEAMTLAATGYQGYNLDLLNVVGFSKPAPGSERALDLLAAIRSDPAFDGHVSSKPGQLDSKSIGDLVERYSEEITRYVNRYEVGKTPDALAENLTELLVTASLLLSATHRDLNSVDLKLRVPQYDFFLLHLFTSAHAALEIFLNPVTETLFTVELKYKIVQTLWTMFIVLYIAQKRPSVILKRVTEPANPDVLPDTDNVDRVWAKIYNILFVKPERYDSHVLKSVRGLLFTSRHVTKDQRARYGVPEKVNGIEFFTLAAYTFAFSMSNQHFIGFERSTETLDIKP